MEINYSPYIHAFARMLTWHYKPEHNHPECNFVNLMILLTGDARFLLKEFKYEITEDNNSRHFCFNCKKVYYSSRFTRILPVCDYEECINLFNSKEFSDQRMNFRSYDQVCQLFYGASLSVREQVLDCIEQTS